MPVTCCDLRLPRGFNLDSSYCVAPGGKKNHLAQHNSQRCYPVVAFCGFCNHAMLGRKNDTISAETPFLIELYTTKCRKLM